MDPTLQVKRLDSHARLPTKGSEASAGWDLYCIESVDIPPGRQALLPTGLAFGIPAGWYGRIAPRSGIALAYAYNVHAGVIDADYTGEVKVALVNHGDHTIEFRRDDRIAQMIVERCSQGELREVSDLSSTDRGTGGMGSSGR